LERVYPIIGKVIGERLVGGSLEKNDEHTGFLNGQGDFYCSYACFCFKGKENEFILHNFEDHGNS